ncbi:hypothetical protein LR48_Vigan04g108500 [Vigna angularis]|uniref:Uncharacterized protein n=1 Tax=Phaseolus angularis TaxID=3914 RepID=A0A0L9UEB9_PHAAN|nr:hypothetical protein LR48_Vigan04g108500 [Vigna angularis]
MAYPWYPNLVRVFYSNLKISDGTLCSRVKGVEIKLTKDVWTSITGFRPKDEKCHLVIEGMNKFSMYQNFLENPNEPRDYSLYRAGRMKREDRLCAFVIVSILLPRGSNHAQLTIKDVCLIHALKEKSCETYNKRNIIDKTALHHMNLRHGPDRWTFKDENLDEETPTGSSTKNFLPKSEFEKSMSLDDDEEENDEVVANDGEEESIPDEMMMISYLGI